MPVELSVIERPLELEVTETTVELGQTFVEVTLVSASTPGPQGPPGVGGVVTADYLVGSAQAGLTSEIVVGLTPGGELGGTWASPTVDATHSGSSHAGVQAAAEATAAGELATHSADTTGVHGVADTSALALTANHPTNATFNDHSARHEDGGADEIVLTGLAGTSVELASHLADATDAHDASAVSVVPFGTIAATQVQAALEEIVSEATAGAPTNADYLVGTANGGLSAEIVVGASPGGELGGTWASPTVAATHSGSSHAAVQAAAEATAASALTTHTADTTSVHGIADTSALVVDGDAAGGVLSGTFPNPGFAADMATQAELDAMLDQAVILAPASSARNVIQPTAGDVIAAIVKAHAAQSVDLTQWQTSGGVVLASVAQTGAVTISPTVNTRGLAVKGAAAFAPGSDLDYWFSDSVARIEAEPDSNNYTSWFSVFPSAAPDEALIQIFGLEFGGWREASYAAIMRDVATGRQIAAGLLAPDLIKIADGDGDGVGQTQFLSFTLNYGSEWYGTNAGKITVAAAVDGSSKILQTDTAGGPKIALFGVAPVAQQAASTLATLWTGLKNYGWLTAGSTVPAVYEPGGTDVAVTDGGTGSSTAAGARTNLGLIIGTDVPGQAAFDDHSARHESGGADAVKLDDLAAPDDNTDLNVSTTKHGLTPKLSNVATEYLSGSGVFSTPSGSGIPSTIVDAKGDLIAASAADTVARLAVGSNGQVLTADSAEATGIKWAAGGGGASALDDLSDVAITSAAVGQRLMRDATGWVNLDARSPFMPTGAKGETFTRMQSGWGGGLLAVSKRLELQAIELPKGIVITSISFVTNGGSNLGTGVHQFFGLYDDAAGTTSGTPYALLRGSNDDTSTAWTTNTYKTLNLTSTYTTTRSGLFYLGLLIEATTMPTMATITSFANAGTHIAPVIRGSSSTNVSALPNPAGTPSGSTFALLYAYVS